MVFILISLIIFTQNTSASGEFTEDSEQIEEFLNHATENDSITTNEEIIIEPENAIARSSKVYKSS